MDFKFGKESEEEELQAPAPEKSRQTGLLVLLLVLLGGFGYLYFFTGLIRPQEQAPAPQPPPQVVKQPLPARDAAAPAVAAKPADTKPQAAVPAQKPGDVKAAAPATKPAPVATAKPEPKKPAVAAAPAQVEPKKAAPAQPAKKVEPAKPAVTAAKPSPEKKANVVKTPAKKEAVTDKAAPAKKTPVAVKKPHVVKTGGPWTVVVGLYVVEELLANDIAKVKKAGLNPIMTSGPKRPVSMNRLFVGEYSSKTDAQQELAKVQQAGGSGFLVEHGDKHAVYAGSYAVLSGAQAEQQRIAAAGVKTSIKKAQVALSSRKLTAGTFTDRKAAEAALKKLKTAGIGTPVLE